MTIKTSPAAPASGRKTARKSPKPPTKWSLRKTEQFMATLTETANVSRSAQSCGMSLAACYQRKTRNADFARQWREALDAGYAELELSLLRQSVQGTERTETVIEGETGTLKYTKTIHSYPFSVALRLFLAHRAEVLAHRQAQETLAIEEGRKTSARTYLEEIRARLLASEGSQDDPDEAPEHWGLGPEAD